jgi:hypothetical protein
MSKVSPLARKLLLKEKTQACFLNTPAGFWHDFGTLPKGVALQSGGMETSDWVLVFAKTEKELLIHGPRALQALKPDGTLWAAFPKKGSGQQTTLTRETGWLSFEEAGFKSMGTASVDAVWTAVQWKRRDVSEA